MDPSPKTLEPLNKVSEPIEISDDDTHVKTFERNKNFLTTTIKYDSITVKHEENAEEESDYDVKKKRRDETKVYEVLGYDDSGDEHLEYKTPQSLPYDNSYFRYVVKDFSFTENILKEMNETYKKKEIFCTACTKDGILTPYSSVHFNQKHLSCKKLPIIPDKCTIINLINLAVFPTIFHNNPAPKGQKTTLQKSPAHLFARKVASYHTIFIDRVEAQVFLERFAELAFHVCLYCREIKPYENCSKTCAKEGLKTDSKCHLTLVYVMSNFSFFTKSPPKRSHKNSQAIVADLTESFIKAGVMEPNNLALMINIISNYPIKIIMINDKGAMVGLKDYVHYYMIKSVF